jgi:putative dimethyl sulfoxide reductase chaperone
MRETNSHHDEDIQKASAHGKTYGSLARIFNQRPDTELVNNIKAMELDFFNQFLGGVDLNSDVKEGLIKISVFVEQIKDQPKKTVEQSLLVDWTRLFRGLQPGYGPKPPYEGVYLGENENDFKALERVARFYIKHGVTPAENAGNRPDYIGLELDFLCYLCEQQAEAWEKGDEGQAFNFQLAEHEFLKDHLGRWGAIFCARVIEEARTDFYRGFAHLTKGIIEEMANTPRPISINKD